MYEECSASLLCGRLVRLYQEGASLRSILRPQIDVLNERLAIFEKFTTNFRCDLDRSR